MVGVGVAFNNCAGLGNDPVGIIYDGIRHAGGMNSEQLGMASNIVNIVLMAVLFFVARRYVNIGTIVYLAPYGLCVDLGNFLYRSLVHSEGMAFRILFSVIGCLLLYIGVAIYITVDIGVDPFTGTVLWLCDLTGKEYRVIKIGFDITLIILGTLLGGKLGAVTLITAVTTGPMIQFFSGLLKVSVLKENKNEGGK